MGDIHSACVHNTWPHPGAWRAEGLHRGASFLKRAYDCETKTYMYVGLLFAEGSQPRICEEYPL